MPFWLWADVIVAAHTAYVAFVVLAVPAILAGWWRHWKWVRNPWFRHLHLAMIGIVVVEAVLGIVCPLTTWEADLRDAAGVEGYSGSFIGHWLDRILFVEFSESVLTVVYVVFGVLVLGLYFMVPPRWPHLGFRQWNS